MIRFAAAGLLMATILAVPVLAQKDKPGKEPEAGQTKSAQQQTSPNSRWRFTIERSKEEDKTDWGRPKCDQPQSHDEADLCEQRRMSEAAESAIFLNRVQTYLGVAGALLLFGTLAFTILSTRAAVKAANATVDAARAAQESAKTAREASHETRRIGEAQVRAYLSSSNPRFTIGQNQIGLGFSFKNTGNSPAFEIRAADYFFSVNNVDDRKGRINERKLYDEPTHDRLIYGVEIAAGETVQNIGISSMYYPEDFNRIRAVALHGGRVEAFVNFYYTDVFDNQHVLGRVFRLLLAEGVHISDNVPLVINANPEDIRSRLGEARQAKPNNKKPNPPG